MQRTNREHSSIEAVTPRWQGPARAGGRWPISPNHSWTSRSCKRLCWKHQHGSRCNHILNCRDKNLYSTMQIKPISGRVLCTKSPLWAQMCDTTNVSNLIISKPDCFIFIYAQNGPCFSKTTHTPQTMFGGFSFSVFNKNHSLKNRHTKWKQTSTQPPQQFYPALPAAFLQGHVPPAPRHADPALRLWN